MIKEQDITKDEVFSEVNSGTSGNHNGRGGRSPLNLSPDCQFQTKGQKVLYEVPEEVPYEAETYIV